MQTESVIKASKDIFLNVILFNFQKFVNANFFFSKVYVHLTESSSENAEEFPEFVKVGSRPDFPTIFGRINQIASQEEKLRIAVVACGPSALVNDTWDQASKHSVSQNRRFDFHHETFEF